MKTLKVVPSVFFCVFRHAAFATHVHVYLWAVLLFISHMHYIIAALARCWLYDIICTCDHINDKIKAILQQLYPSESKMPPAYLFPNNRHFHCEGDIQSLSVHWLNLDLIYKPDTNHCIRTWIEASIVMAGLLGDVILWHTYVNYTLKSGLL